MALRSHRGWPDGRIRGLLIVALGLPAGLPLSAQMTVSASGQATASIPIPVPPGIAGMAPNLYLQYTDGGINGHLGVGWSLQGISMITRCPASRLVDGKAAPVEFKPTDKLCLDGQRLIPSDASGNATTLANGDANGVGTSDSINPSSYQEYRTEKDTFARIRAYGATGGVASNGPAAFRVWTKAGQIYEYGTNFDGNANARIAPFNSTSSPPASRSQAAVWAVSRISDVKGNYVNFKYISVTPTWGSGTSAGVFIGQEWGLMEVQYTGVNNLTASPAINQVPANKVVIEYEPRPTTSTAGYDRAETNQYGNKNLLTYRIKAIRTYVNSPNPTVLGAADTAVKARTVLFTYELSGSTGRSRLTNVKECVDNAETVCLPSRSFSYQNGTAPPSISFASNSSFNGVLGTKKLTDTSGAYGALTGDFNGDGLTDIARYSYAATENEVWLSQGGGNFILAFSYNLGSTQLFSADGCYSAIVADFNGDSLSDILRIRKTSCGVGNVLLLNQGNGTFSSISLPASMDLEQVKVQYSQGSSDCTFPQAAPGPIDSVSSSSTTSSTIGSTARRPVPTSGRLNSGSAPQPSAALPAGALSTAPSTKAGTPYAPAGGACVQYNRNAGKRFYLLDLNADGVLDIVTTIAVPYSWNSNWGNVPSEQELCWGSGNPAWFGNCSRVYKGSSTGTFTEETETSIKYSSLYAHPPKRYGGSDPWNNPYWRMPDLADLDGDGLLDVLAEYTGRWRSDGNFGFFSSPSQAYNYVCPTSIDFNGDGRADCLWPTSSASSQSLNISFGADASGNVTQFNLTGTGDNLYGVDAQQRQNVGLLVEDFDGDGRQDILRWGPTPSDNGIYFSNGEGSFRTRAGAGLTSITRPLNAADGTANIVLGDFLGTGALQILHMKHSPTATGDPATSNQLYSRTYSPVDVLATTTSPTGLVTTVGSRVPLTNSGGRYINERGTVDAAVAPVVDLQMPMFVITSLTQDTGTGGTTSITTQYLYKGLKAERGGRGLLGFREVRQQNPAPGGKSLTIATRHLLAFPYDGVASRSTTYANSSASLALEPLSGQTISRTVNVYCDATSSAGAANSATETAPCTTTAKITKPYLRKSVEEGWELGSSSIVLPKVTTVNSYNSWGDPTTIQVTTEALFDNATPYTTNRQYIKTTTNTFCNPSTDTSGALQCPVGSTTIPSPNDTRGEKWILGRLSRSTVRNQVPNLTSVLTTGPGSGSTALQGP